MIRRLEKNQIEKGSALLIGIFLAMVLLLSIAEIVKYLGSSQKLSLKIDKGEKAFFLADSGIQDALANLRNPSFDFTKTIEGKDPQNPNMGKYYVSFKPQTVLSDGTQNIVILSSGTAYGPDGQELVTRRIQATVQTVDLGNYNFFITGDQQYQQLPGGVVLAGKVYAPKIQFVNMDATHPVKAGSITYFKGEGNLKNYQGNESYLLDPESSQQIIPEEIEQKKDSLHLGEDKNDGKTLLGKYYNRANAADSEGNNKEAGIIKNPKEFTGGGVIKPPKNGQEVYFYDGSDPLEIKGEIQGKVLFVAPNADIKIIGDITYPTGDDASKVGLFTNKDVVFDKYAAGNDGKLEVHAQVFAPEGSFRTEESDDKTNYPQNSFEFYGSVIAKNPLLSFAMVYTGTVENRKYIFDKRLATDPFPEVFKIADIVEWKEVTEFK